MSSLITKESSSSDVAAWLKEKGLNEAASEMQTNEIDGEDFFGLDLTEINQLLPKFKIRKRFLAAWSEATKLVFDGDGIKCPFEVPAACSPSTSEGTTCSVVYEKRSTPLSNTCDESILLVSSVIESDNQSDCDSDDTSNVPPARKSLEFRASLLRRSPMKLKRSSSSPSSSVSPKKRKPEVVADVPVKSDWLCTFCIPTRWEPDVEQGLRKGSLTPLQKNALIRQLCISIMAHTSYPVVAERTHIALQLVMKYPFLKGSFGAGHQIWVKKIQERFANVKKKLAKAERKSLEADGIVVPKGKPGRKKKQGKNNTVPAIPDGETDETLEIQRQKLVEMFRKGSSDSVQVKVLMDNTYPKRRRDVLLENIRVWKLLQDYPFLKDDKGIQIKAELARIQGSPGIAKDIRELWEIKKPHILSALKKSQSRAVSTILAMLDDCEMADEKELENRCILAALPYALGERATSKYIPGELFFEVVNSDSQIQHAEKVKACSTPRLLATGSLEEISSLALISEGMVVVKFRGSTIISAVTCLLAAYYVFNAEYPKGATGLGKNIYIFLEHILLGSASQTLPIGVENFLTLL